MNPNSVYLLIFISLITISLARGNYGYGQQLGNRVCDKNVYNRAKDIIRSEVQQRPQNNGGFGGNQRSLNNGGFGGGSQISSQYDSRYPLTNGYQVNNLTNNRNYLTDQWEEHRCKLLGQAFVDILIFTPLCDIIGSIEFRVSVDLIKECRVILMQHCEQNQGWRHAQCFRRREIMDCENQYNYFKQTPTIRSESGSRNFINNNPLNQNNQPYNHPVSYELCQAFETFRNCVLTHSRSQCYTSDLDHLGTYFVDKAHDAVWSCSPNHNMINNNQDSFSRRTDIIHYQSNQPGSGGFYPPPSTHFQNIPGETLSPYQQSGQPFPIINHNGNGIDRAGGALSGQYAGSVSACIERVRPFETSCLDHLIQRQREARYGRSSTDVQRRICCALFRYRDCLSRVVLETCFDNSRVAVDILMGDRNREITQTCRDITRDQCNGFKKLYSSIHLISLSILIAMTSLFKN